VKTIVAFRASYSRASFLAAARTARQSFSIPRPGRGGSLAGRFQHSRFDGGIERVAEIHARAPEPLAAEDIAHYLVWTGVLDRAGSLST
jgi:hypothetical protein